MEKTNEFPKLASITQCSIISGLAYSTIRRMILEGKIKYIKTGKKYLVNIDSLSEYLNGNGGN